MSKHPARTSTRHSKTKTAFAQLPPSPKSKTSHKSFLQTFQQSWQLIVFVILGVLVRFWNFHNSLYFIYDQGRDALVLNNIVHGHPVLVGPTSGLNGVFLGPLWYYLGVPGFLLGQGNPYVICLWYMAISCFALPLFWYFAHKLFKEKIWAILCAIFLATVPGSIQASVFIWNPLLSVPLMVGAILAFWRARTSRLWLAIGFLLLAMTLQSEFAYAVFFLPCLFILIPWIRQRWHWKDFATAIVTVGITAVPQLFFEVRNHFIMTTSFLHSMTDTSQSVTWKVLWSMRPTHLMDVTRLLLLGESYGLWMFNVIILLLISLAVFAFIQMHWWQKRNDEETGLTPSEKSTFFLWQLVFLCAVIPYPFYMLWRGNHGYFFSYYLTPHFIFLVPIIILGIREIVRLGQRMKGRNHLPFSPFLMIIVATICIGLFGVASYHHWNGVVFRPQNNAGLAKMTTAVSQIYAWHQQDTTDTTQPWVVKTYTANVYTEQYDYLFSWYGKAYHLAPPQTVLSGQEKIWYVLVESQSHAIPFFFAPWYATSTKDGHKVREEQVGVLTLETWRK